MIVFGIHRNFFHCFIYSTETCSSNVSYSVSYSNVRARKIGHVSEVLFRRVPDRHQARNLSRPAFLLVEAIPFAAKGPFMEAINF